MSFFYGETKTIKKATRSRQVPTSALNKAGCTGCPLNREKGLCHPKMLAEGAEGGDCELYVLGGALELEDDEEGYHFVSENSDRVLKEFSADYLENKARFNNVTNCYTPNDKLSDTALESCRNRIEDDIAEHKPKVILGIGPMALRWAVGSNDVSLWRGRIFPIEVKGHLCWFMPSYDGAFLKYKERRNKKGDVKRNEFDHIVTHDMARLKLHLKNDTLGKPFKEDPDKYFDGVEVIMGSGGERDLRRLEKRLEELKKEPMVGFDYETTALRPYNDDAMILSCAVGTYEKTVAFPLEHPDGWKTRELKDKAHDLVYDFIKNSGIKVCHNLKFEQEWTCEFYGDELIHGAQWEDTMAQGYILDNRKGMLSLDILTRLHLGFSLKSVTGVSAKDWEGYDLKEYLTYNALDSKYTHLLYGKQQKILDENKSLDWVHKHLITASGTLALTQNLGIYPNKRNIRRFSKDLTGKIEDILDQIKVIPEVIKFAKDFKSFNAQSNDQLQLLFTKYFGLDKELKDAKGKIKTDEPTLSKIDLPICKLVLELRAVAKLKSTYVDSMGDLTFDDGKIHTEFTLYYTSTGRLSSKNPNCFPPTVEVLTDSGWHFFGSVPAGSKVAQCDVDTLAIDFVEPLNSIEQHFDGNLISLKTDNFLDIISTPNHRFPTIDRVNGGTKFKEASCYPKDRLQICSGLNRSGKTKMRQSQIILLCALQGDGSINSSGGIDWGFYKKRKYDNLIGALDCEGISYTIGKSKSKGYRVYVSAKGIPEWLKGRKFFDWDILDYDQKSLEFFCDEIWKWDGDFTREATWVSACKKNADVVQAALNLCGRRANIVEMSGKTCKKYYTVNVSRRQVFSTANHTKTEVPYKGEVYCYTMPKGTLIVRYNGKTLVAGNCQNFPKRKFQYIRGVIGTPKDHTFAAIDFGQLEARIIGCASNDKSFCDAIWDDYDVHQFWAEYIAHEIPSLVGGKKFLKDKAAIKKFRGAIKNKMVFPAFYGASPYSIAGYLEADPKKMLPIFDKFWETFSGVKSWQERVIKGYDKNAYVESLTGRRRYGPIGYNEIINTGIQGAASDIVVNAMNKLSKQGYQARLNIHDDLSFYLHNSTLDEDLNNIVEIMCKSPTEDFDFVTVPMAVEVELGKDWANLSPLKTVTSKDFGFKRAA